MSDEALEVRGILETCLYAVELEDAVEFYERVIGLEAFSRVAGRHTFFRCGEAVFLLFNPEKTREGGDVPAHGAYGPGHVAFSVPAGDMGGWRRRLERLGTAVEQEIEWPGGGRSLYLRDPAGNSVELATPALWSITE